MRKLKIILKYNYVYAILIVFTMIYVAISLFLIPNRSKYDIDNNNFLCVIDSYYIEGDVAKINLDCNEKISGYYYFNSVEEKKQFQKNIKLGDIIQIKGDLQQFEENSNTNLFDYKFYQYTNGYFYKLTISSYNKLGTSSNIIFKVKNFLINRTNNLKSYPYINALILGNKNYIDNRVLNSYQILGIMHLFAISGMHVGLFTKLFDKIIKNEKKRYIVTSIFLILYYLLIESVSLLRSLLFYLINRANKLYELNISKPKIVIIIASILLIYNPWHIYSIAFWYSFLIGSSLFLLSNKINNKKTYIGKSLYISFISFLLSFPITIYNFFEVNLLSCFYNLIFIPLVSFILYPLTLLTTIIPLLDNLLITIILLFEKLALYLSDYSLSLVFSKPSLIIVFLYYLVIFICLKEKKYLIILFILVLFHLNINYIIKKDYLIFIDIGQGDSTYINYNNKSILIDTGGKIKYQTEQWRKKENYSIAKNITIPLIKSYGISKIDILILSHGDYDHMGEAIKLVENFKVEKVIFNCGEFNELEQDLIKVLDKKKIPYYSCIKELNIDDNKLYFLNNKDYGNENDNSSVIYTELNKHKFLFMGDAGVGVEEDLIKKYNLKDIDVLKVGHHGSKTSSSKIFIDEIKPKYSIISVGKNNKYGHPNKEALEVLKISKIYRTDQDGSILFKIKNNKLNVETCSL